MTLRATWNSRLCRDWMCHRQAKILPLRAALHSSRNLQEGLKTWGVPSSHIHSEVFGAGSALTPGISSAPSSPPHQPIGPIGAGPKISFTRSGLTAPWDPRFSSILEFAEACDVPVQMVLSGGCLPQLRIRTHRWQDQLCPGADRQARSRKHLDLLLDAIVRAGTGSLRRCCSPSGAGLLKILRAVWVARFGICFTQD